MLKLNKTKALIRGLEPVRLALRFKRIEDVQRVQDIQLDKILVETIS